MSIKFHDPSATAYLNGTGVLTMTELESTAGRVWPRRTPAIIRESLESPLDEPAYVLEIRGEEVFVAHCEVTFIDTPAAAADPGWADYIGER